MKEISRKKGCGRDMVSDFVTIFNNASDLLDKLITPE